MKKSIIFIILLQCFSFTYAQNSDVKPVTVLYIIKSDVGDIKKTHNFFVESDEIAKLELPRKDEILKKLGPITEDVVAYVTLKQGVKLLTLSNLLKNKKLDDNYNNIPVYINGEALSDSEDFLASEMSLKDIKRTSKRIDIITKSGFTHKKLPGLRTRH